MSFSGEQSILVEGRPESGEFGGRRGEVTGGLPNSSQR